MSAAVLAIGIFFIVYGAYRGEVETVFSKAVRICLECVGIG
ncbi:CD1871A family CXXC motif-containing protein [Suipraeoptans intestinalis]|nr:CD1871A family CXXC motif-containing protein [Suipraeoptans intestinalis]MDD7769426.1 CD1871A family CXXC motif-containing protein [Suipraeoptans intestinalis]MDY3121012.1 CD1871A family CXXC motif-containing protein [Suipraeoptans intestinalis]